MYHATLYVQDSVCFDESEVDIGSWLSYYTWKLKNEGIESAQKVLPDSMEVLPEVWQYINHRCEPSDGMIVSIYMGRYGLQPMGDFCKKCNDFIEYDKRLRSYSSDCPFIDYPVTGITYEQAKHFCEWRTKVQGGEELVFRLPTSSEWKNFAMNGLNEIQQKNGICDSLGKCKVFNYRADKCDCDIPYFGTVPLRTEGFFPNNLGAYDVFGNVSEMTATKGESLGGNFRQRAVQCHIDSVQYYTKPEDWLGFRCIAIRKNIKK